MSISAQEVKTLRDRTGAGMMDCKKALQKADGDMDEAVEYLRKQGVAKAEKKSGREANEGRITSYIHPGGRIGVLLELNCETDFVAKTDDFNELAKDIAMQIAAMDPVAVSREELDDSLIEKEKKLYREQAVDEGKPEHVLDQIIEGKLEKYFSEVVLLEQPFVKDNDKTIEQLVTDSIAKLGENISVSRFSRFELGEDSAEE